MIKLPNKIILFSGIKAWGLKNSDSITGNIEDQCQDIFKQIDILLAEQGLGKDSIQRVQCFLTNIDDYLSFNTKYIEWIKDHKPVRSVIGCYKLRYNAKVELILDCYDNK